MSYVYSNIKAEHVYKFGCFLNNAIINYTDSIRGQLPCLSSGKLGQLVYVYV